MSGVLFVLCAGIIFYAGKKLSYYGDVIARLSGLGKAWFGLVLMAAVTSLPELSVSISSAAIVESADLAVGDVIGSCAFNLCILSLLDVFVSSRKPLFSLVTTGHTLAGGIGILLISLVGLGIYLPGDFRVVGWVGSLSFIFILLYFLAVRIIYQYEQAHAGESNDTQVERTSEPLSLKKAILYYIAFACLVVGAAVFLPYFAESIAKSTGLSATFVGTLFLAVSTSLPEVAVSVAAIRLGAVDMAVGNMFGSNIFNILILAIADVFYKKGPLLKQASDTHLISVFCVIIMTAISIIGLTYRPKVKNFILAWDTLLMLIVFVINLILLHSASKV